MTACCQRIRQKFLPQDFSSELKATIKLSIPIVMLTVLQYLILEEALIFCGHMGKLEIDAVSLAISLFNAFVSASALGLTEGYETLFTQAYGSENKKLMGIYLQRSLFIHLLAFLICLAILINAEGICILFGQDREIAALTGQYIIRFIPGTFGNFFYTVLSRYLQDMNKGLPTLIIVITGNIINIAAHFLFINGLGFGIEGSAYAISVTFMSMLIIIVCYACFCEEFAKTWPGWSSEMWRGWGKIMRLGSAALVSLCFETWAFEITIFLAGTLGPTDLAAQTIGINIDGTLFYVLSGISITGTIRVGQHLGAGDALAAKTACFTNIISSSIPIVVMVILVATLNTELPKIFTNVPEIIELTAKILPIVAVYTLMTGVSAWATGVFRGIGRQHISAVCVFIAYYIIGLPLAICLMYLTSLRIIGIWVSLSCSLCIVALCMAVIVFKTDWDKQVGRAAANTSYSAGDVKEDINEKTALLKQSEITKGKCGMGETNAHNVYVSDCKESQENLEAGGTLTNLNDRNVQPGKQKPHRDSDVEDITKGQRMGELETQHTEALESVLLKRIIIIVIFLCIFALALSIRIMIPLPPLTVHNNINSTDTKTLYTETTETLLAIVH